MNRRALLETTSFCKQISAFACDFNHTALSSCHFAAVANTLLDTHAVAVAGWFEPAALRLRSYLKVSGALTGKRHSQAGLCRLWGEDEWVFPEAAALANGVAAHVLDFDDVSSAMRGHPSVALWPGLLALAEARDVPGVRLASAFVVGFEVLLKLSRAMAQEHYALGWHSTSTLGTIAGAVACSHLLSHNAQQVEASIGIAIAQCAGSRQNFGSDTKSFQAGHCNAAAVRAALLASEGFTAGEGALDGPGGFVDLYGGHTEEVRRELALLGQGQLELVGSGVEVKKYPMCYAAHRALDGMLDLCAESKLNLEDVLQIRVTSSRGGLTPLIHHRPVTGLEAKFSMEYGVVAALADGGVTLASFTDHAVNRLPVQNMLPRVNVAEEGDSLFPRWTRIDLTLRSGVSLVREIRTLRGSAETPLSDNELIVKADDCYRFGRSEFNGEKTLSAARDLSNTGTSAFVEAAFGSQGAQCAKVNLNAGIVPV